MATKKSRPRGRATAKRATSTARAAARKAKPTPKKKPTGRVTSASKAPKRPVKAARPTAKAAIENKEVTALKARFQRERNGLEKNLTEAVREIGLLRLHEFRVTQLERQVKERDDLIARLQDQLAEIDRRPAEPVYEHEVQQSFALSSPNPDLDEFEDDNPTGEDGSLAEEDER